ncbi:hypothetical protein BH10BAC3_BH10BAC3_24780 [soil metagenome]
MFDIFLALNLTGHIFSTEKDSLRFPTHRRLFSVLFILPLFFLLIIANRFFMMLDWIVFPGFRKMPLNNLCFIIGVPRSATTYLLHILARDNDQFTCFKLWEILFAPSIIQKYILLPVLKLDRLLGRPLYRLSIKMDKAFLGKIAVLHEISLSKPEEDEILLVYAFASMYLAFFFPGVKALDPHLFFDEDLSPAKRKKIMLFYKRCVQRHCFVFNRNEQKYFLSKNPCFISKIASIGETFPQASLVYMLRSPFKTIPSTLILNSNVYSLFSGVKYENPLYEKTTRAIIRWYQMADRSIEKYWRHRCITVPFRKVTSQPGQTIKEVYDFLKLSPAPKMNLLLQKEDDNSRNYKSLHKYNEKPGLLQEEISSELQFIIHGKYRDQL